jgi:hypothetical protein
MSEPWINFSDKEQDLDLVIFLRPDGLERVHIYKRPSGSIGLKNFFRASSDSIDLWEVGMSWGHYYDAVSTAIKEAFGHFPWMREDISIGDK